MDILVFFSLKGNYLLLSCQEARSPITIPQSGWWMLSQLSEKTGLYHKEMQTNK